MPWKKLSMLKEAYLHPASVNAASGVFHGNESVGFFCTGTHLAMTASLYSESSPLTQTAPIEAMLLTWTWTIYKKDGSPMSYTEARQFFKADPSQRWVMLCCLAAHLSGQWQRNIESCFHRVSSHQNSLQLQHS